MTKPLTSNEFRSILRRIKHVDSIFRINKILEEVNTTKSNLELIDKNKRQPSHPLISYGDSDEEPN